MLSKLSKFRRKRTNGRIELTCRGRNRRNKGYLVGRWNCVPWGGWQQRQRGVRCKIEVLTWLIEWCWTAEAGSRVLLSTLCLAYLQWQPTWINLWNVTAWKYRIQQPIILLARVRSASWEVTCLAKRTAVNYIRPFCLTSGGLNITRIKKCYSLEIAFRSTAAHSLNQKKRRKEMLQIKVIKYYSTRILELR